MDPADSSPPSPEVVARLVAGHREFLRFLEARLKDRDVAEEVLQAAFVRSLEKGGAIEDARSAVAWFYRLLRNAMVDHYRRRDVEARALERQRSEPPTHDAELHDAVCACMRLLLPNLKAEYAEVVRRADLEERPIGEVATELGISENNATVRLHRARKALKRELERSCGTCATHGCLDCSCAATQRALDA